MVPFDLVLLIGRILAIVVPSETEANSIINNQGFHLNICDQCRRLQPVAGKPKFTSFTIYNNGVLNPTTNEFLPLDPEYFAVSPLPYHCIIEKIDTSSFREVAPKTYDLLYQICDSDNQILEYLRSIIHVILKKENKLQLWFLFLGFDGIGQFVLIHLICAMIQPQYWFSSNLETLAWFDFTVKDRYLLILPNLPEEVTGIQYIELLSEKSRWATRNVLIGKDGLPLVKVMDYHGHVILATNHMITLQDTSDTILRKLSIFPTYKPILKDSRNIYIEKSEINMLVH